MEINKKLGDSLINIVIVTPFFNEYPNRKSGLMLLVKELSKYEDITIISSKVEGTQSIEIINPNLRIIRFKPTFYFPSLPYTLDIFQLKDILRVCKQRNCDIIISYSLQFFSSFSAAIAAKLGGYPFICRIVGASQTTNKMGIEFLSKIYDRSLAKITLKRADKIIVQTERMKARPLALGAKISKVVIVEDGIDLNRFSLTRKKDKNLQELNLDKSKIVISFISRLVKLKGIEDLIYVAKDLVNQYSNIVFLIAGTGPLRAKLENQTRLIERIRFLGYRNDVPNLLKLSDIFILPSYSEGLSPAILEAFASGLPVITTKVGSNPDIIINGENGFLIEPGDKSALKNSIIKLIEDKDLREKMGINNKKLIHDNFNIENIALKFLAVLENLVKA